MFACQEKTAKHSSLFYHSICEEEKMFYNIDICLNIFYHLFLFFFFLQEHNQSFSLLLQNI